jgi:hypothetical protein
MSLMQCLQFQHHSPVKIFGVTVRRTERTATVQRLNHKFPPTLKILKEVFRHLLIFLSRSNYPQIWNQQSILLDSKCQRLNHKLPLILKILKAVQKLLLTFSSRSNRPQIWNRQSILLACKCQAYLTLHHTFHHVH